MSENKKIVILGAGTAGTIMANKLQKKAGRKHWDVTVVDQFTRHYYQPGFLFYPFGRYSEHSIMRDRTKFLPKGVRYVQEQVEKVDAKQKKVKLQSHTLDYDLLIIATGSRIAPEETPGMAGEEWHKTIFDFYTFEGAAALREKLKGFKRGTLVVNITEMPIKCPVAPIEFCFLADEFFRKRGLRKQVKIKFVTPLDGAFTQPVCSKKLGYLFKDKDIELITDYGLERIDTDKKQLVSYDNRKIKYSLLVTVPTNKGDDLIERSELGDELNFIPVDKATLQSKAHDNIFAIGDAADVPTSKAGSVAHFQADTLAENVDRYFAGQELEASFDGHTNCFIESGDGKALLVDFNYDTQPLEGKFPFPLFGPLKLLSESRLNHWGKLAFRWVYWHVLMRGRPMPGISNQMKMWGKKQDIIKLKE